MELGVILAADNSCQIIKQFQLVGGHQYPGDHSSMDKETLVGRQINSILFILVGPHLFAVFASCWRDSSARRMCPYNP